MLVYARTCTHSVVEASVVSARLSWPSSAMPRLSRLLASDGDRCSTFCRLEPGCRGQPSLDIYDFKLYLLLLVAAYKKLQRPKVNYNDDRY